MPALSNCGLRVNYLTSVAADERRSVVTVVAV